LYYQIGNGADASNTPPTMSHHLPTTTHPTLRILAEKINNQSTGDYCGGVEIYSHFAVRMDGESMRIDLVREGQDIFSDVLIVMVKDAGEGPQWSTIAAWGESREPSSKGYCMMPGETAAVQTLAKHVRDTLRRNWEVPQVQITAPIVNLTPHPIHVLDADNNTLLAIPASGLPVPRAEKTTTAVAVVEMDGIEIPVLRPSFGEVANLPEPVKGTVFIVSLIVQQACPDRTDLLIVEDVVRDGSTIKGCRAFGIK
jgi:hypothetical protein